MVITGDPVTRRVWVDNRHLGVKPSQRVYNHSPDGFSWGYEGSGPAQLALAILLYAGIEPRTAVLLHQEFKREVLAPLPMDQSFAIDLDIVAWCRARTPSEP